MRAPGAAGPSAVETKTEEARLLPFSLDGRFRRPISRPIAAFDRSRFEPGSNAISFGVRWNRELAACGLRLAASTSTSTSTSASASASASTSASTSTRTRTRTCARAPTSVAAAAPLPPSPRRAAPLRRGAAAPPDRAVASSHLDTRARARAARMRAFAAMRVRMFVALARAGFTDVRAQPANIARPCTAPRDRAGCESAHQRAIDIEPHAGGEARRIGLPKARDRTLVACSRARIACAHARFISFVHRLLPAVRHRDRRRAQSACPPPCFGNTASATRLRYRFGTVSTRSGHRGRLTTGTVPARARPACDAGRARPRRAA